MFQDVTKYFSAAVESVFADGGNTGRRNFVTKGVAAAAVVVGLGATFPTAAEAKVALPATLTRAEMLKIAREHANNFPGANSALYTKFGIPMSGEWRASNGVIVQYDQNGSKGENPCDVVALTERTCDINKNKTDQQLADARREFQEWSAEISNGEINYVSTYSVTNDNSCVVPDRGGNGGGQPGGHPGKMGDAGKAISKTPTPTGFA